MGLEHGPYLLIAHAHGGGQHSGELGGVVGKVISHSYSVKLA